MQLAAVIRQGQIKNPRSVKLDDFKIQFGQGEKITEDNAQQRAQKSKSFWAPLLVLAEVKG